MNNFKLTRQDFTPVPSAPLRSTVLSLEAKGLLAALCAMEETEARSEELFPSLTEEKFNALIAELSDADYLRIDGDTYYPY